MVRASELARVTEVTLLLELEAAVLAYGTAPNKKSGKVSNKRNGYLDNEEELILVFNLGEERSTFPYWKWMGVSWRCWQPLGISIGGYQFLLKGGRVFENGCRVIW